MRQSNRAEEVYRSALAGAESHEAFDQAKTQFAALEGLADVYMQKAGALDMSGAWPILVDLPGAEEESYRDGVL